MELNSVKQAIQNGKTITHCLSLDSSEQIKQYLFEEINNKPKAYTINGNPDIIITWTSESPLDSFYTNSMYNDTITSLHVNKMLSDILSDIKRRYILETYKISYLLTNIIQFGMDQESTGVVY